MVQPLVGMFKAFPLPSILITVRLILQLTNLAVRKQLMFLKWFPLHVAKSGNSGMRMTNQPKLSLLLAFLYQQEKKKKKKKCIDGNPMLTDKKKKGFEELKE